MNRFKLLFGKKQCSVIAMIHLDALPGSPLFGGSIQKIVDKACKEMDIYMNCGVDGILVENMNDIPYVQANKLKPETTATMSRVCTEIKKQLNGAKIPCGIQILAGGNEEAIAVAQACDFDFIRAEGFVFSHVADEGFTDAVAGSLLRYRRNINAENILVFTDIKKKHSSHAITSDVSLVETAKAAEFFMSDGLILTGTATGSPANKNELQELKNNIPLPVIVGSGVTEKNVQDYLSADALIIGSHFKKDGYWKNDIDLGVVKKFMNSIRTMSNV